MVIIPNVQDNVFCGRGLFDFEHTAKGLINAIAADAIVANWLLKMRRQIFLPGFSIADLIAVGEAVAVGVGPVCAPCCEDGVLQAVTRSNTPTTLSGNRHQLFLQGIFEPPWQLLKRI